MKVLAQRNYTILQYAKALEWGKLISITGGAQVIVQLTSFISGILIIRLLPTQEYALYTLANTMLGMMILMADSGVSSSIMAQGGQCWDNRVKLGVILSTGMRLRYLLAFFSFIIVIPFLIYMLHTHGASWSMSSLISICLIPAFILSLSGGLLEIPLKLNQNILALQRVQVGSNLGRLLLLSFSMFFFPWVTLAILIAAPSQLWANRKLRRLSSIHADLSQRPDPEVRVKILFVVKRILPTSIYYAFSGQITIWLVSFLGTTIYVAQIGALSRLSMVLAFLNVIYGTLLIPHLAKQPSKRKILLKKYLQTQVLLFVFLSVFIVSAWIFSTPLLWILGSQYAGLNKELTLSIIGSCISFISGSSFGFYTSRGWVLKPAIVIFFDLIVIITGVLMFKTSTLQGILLFNIYIATMLWLLNFVYSLFKIIRLND